MNNSDKEYQRLLDLVLTKGRRKKNRTGVDTFGVFGAQARFDLSEGFPLLTTKKVFFKGIVHELLWFIAGSTNIKYLVDNGVNIWNANAYAKFKKEHEKYLYNKEIMSERQYIDSIKASGPGDYGFAAKYGDLGEGTYGGMWRAFPYAYQETTDPFSIVATKIGHVDQLKKVIEKLQTNPDDRRIIVSAWHPHWVDHCALPPCHVLFHFNTEELTARERFEIAMKVPDQNPYELRPAIWDDEIVHGTCDGKGIPRRRLNCLLYQRSCDLFLGVPFNIASYALLTQMVAHCVNMVPGEFIHTYGDLHIYENHVDQCKEQLAREPMALPQVVINPAKKDLFEIKFEDVSLINYNSHPAIKGEMAV